MLRTSVVLPSPCLTGYDWEQELLAQLVLEDRENANESAFVATGASAACLEAIRSYAHDLRAAVRAAAERRQR